MTNNYFKLLAVITSTSVICMLGCSKSDSKKSVGESRGAGTSVDAVIVKTSPIQRKLQVPGSILPNEQVELKSEAAGKLVELNIVEGATVKKGDLLARINDSELKALLQKKQLDEKLAADDVARKKRLIEIDAISIQDFEAAQNKLDGIRAEIAQTEAQIAKAEVRAPFDGRIGLRNVSLGSYISISTTLATLVQDNPLKIEFSVPERYTTLIKNGTPVIFSVGDQHTQYQAAVYAVESAIDPNTRSLKVRAIYANRSRSIIPGTFAKVNIIFQNSPDAIQIPPQAIVPEMETQTVLIAQKGRAVKRVVNIGERTSQLAEIIEGVNIGDTIITTGLTSIRDGSRVVVNVLE